MDKTTEQKTSQTFSKPNAIIYNIVAFFARIYLWFKFRPKYNTDSLKELKKKGGPAIIMCSHTSNLDFLHVAVALLPLRPTYIMSNHFFSHPKIGPLLRPLHAIPKKMFCADINAMRQILKANKSGNVIVMFPEGRLSCYGHTVQVADGTAELVRKLGSDVYWLRENGAYKALPKWGKAGVRKGPVSVDTGKLFDAEEVKYLSVESIERQLSEAILHDDETSFPDSVYKCTSPAHGLDGILYKCPVCGKEFCMESLAVSLSCTTCGASWTLNEKYQLAGPVFSSINDWFRWEQNRINLDAGLETDCILATPDESGVTDRNAGHGVISIDRENIRFVGECHGKPLEFVEKTSFIKAFPATVGDHFDIYSDRIMYNIIPQPNPAEAIKWVQYLDKLSEESASE